MLGLLNLRNTPRDNNLSSSRRTRTAIPTSKKLFVPKVIPCKRVSQRIREKRRQQKLYYDKNAKMLGILKENQVVRIQTARGYDKLGVVKKTTKEPRSYMVETDGKEYRRNRRHLLAVCPKEITSLKKNLMSSYHLKIPTIRDQLSILQIVGFTMKTIKLKKPQLHLKKILQLTTHIHWAVKCRRKPVV